MKWTWMFIGSLLILTGCVSTSQITTDTSEPTWPEERAVALANDGQYHQAMLALVEEMQEYSEYTEQTGDTVEGAAGLIYYTVMSHIAVHGDADWGKILDDPDIPYHYKTDMLFEVTENRLGKGSVWSAQGHIVMIPGYEPVESWDELRDLLRETVFEQ